MSATGEATGKARRLVMGVSRSFGVWNRRRKWRRIAALVKARSVRRALLVGVSGAAYKGEDLIETAVSAAVPFSVACGLTAPTTGSFPRFVVCDALALPFRDR
ncbi:MAG TPA: hypothetical protein VG795_07310, partial [Acidimicrobiia bacterium]|nr:hypothetical protein [Acidimicrobiia bacterium]